MSAKTICIVIISVLLTIILMNNTDEVNFWIFGNALVPKLAVLGVMFGLGLIVGFVAGRPRKKPAAISENFYPDDREEANKPKHLSDEDRDYIQ